jgi:hypothetical protein
MAGEVDPFSHVGKGTANPLYIPKASIQKLLGFDEIVGLILGHEKFCTAQVSNMSSQTTSDMYDRPVLE